LSIAAGRAPDNRHAKRIRTIETTGTTVGWHTTGQNEESLIILRGRGEALIEDHEKQSFASPAFAYIPPNTKHNVSNTGKEMLEYVYVVAPAARR
jgi:mannose-6-phosphate isomerase-like protein (cupin superfamily)